MEFNDADDRAFEPAPLRPPDTQGRVDHDGAKIWYATYGSGAPVLLLHGAFGSGEDWGNQVPALVDAGRRVVLVDSRGNGRSTRDIRPLTYERAAADVLAVMDALDLAKCAVVGWSDGAIIGLVLAMKNAARVTRVFAFGGNMDLGGVRDVSPSHPAVARAYARAAKIYAQISETPTEFASFSRAVLHLITTQPNYSANELAGLGVPVAIVQAEGDEFIKPEHAEYLARTIPDAKLIRLPGATHFALWQRPDDLNDAVLSFLGEA
jgi:pimeloyl-ACP methyl ester carboxylesterase